MIVALLTGLEEARAQTLLSDCNGEIKTAILTGRCGVSPELARDWLKETGGNLREAAAKAAFAKKVKLPSLKKGLDPRRLIAGVDAGGSKTIAVVAALSEPEMALGRGKSGPGNVADGFGPSTLSIEAAIAEARQGANCLPGPFAAICLAVAGSGTDEARGALEAWAERINLAEKVLVVHDAYPVLACAAPQGAGIAIISSTGSIAFGRNTAGETARAGGWGRLVGDESNGYGIAIAGARAVVRAADGLGPATALTEGFLNHLRAKDERSMLTALNRLNATPAKVATLAEIVVDSADRRDRVALQILEAAAEQLAALTAAASAKLHLVPQSFALGLAGGLLLNSQLLQDLLLASLRNRDLEPCQMIKVDRPELGSLRLAEQAIRESRPV
jgi:N-acetylglucosamine kinase-like BadF-type ATPase